ncbi:MAG TPA: hypothetical protein ENI23_07565 [bacterium]|nr:hypothetical protein [bacterium]
MEITHDFPPNFTEIEDAFGSIPITIVFTYGDIIYAPGHGDISEHLMIHEKIHSEQQGNDPEDWWKRYLTESDFRLKQEVEAYYAQYSSFKRAHRDKNLQIRYLYQIAADLSSTIYGSIVTHREAMNLITQGKRR